MIKDLFLSTAIVVLISSSVAIANQQHHHRHKHHSQLEVGQQKQIPSIKIKLHPDVISGWNLEVVTENFEFAPSQVNQTHQMGKGHAHLYIDGIKIERLYSHWRHITGLSAGKHTIKVTLNSNDHQDYVIDGVVVGDQVEIEQK